MSALVAYEDAIARDTAGRPVTAEEWRALDAELVHASMPWWVTRDQAAKLCDRAADCARRAEAAHAREWSGRR